MDDNLVFICQVPNIKIDQKDDFLKFLEKLKKAVAYQLKTKQTIVRESIIIASKSADGSILETPQTLSIPRSIVEDSDENYRKLICEISKQTCATGLVSVAEVWKKDNDKVGRQQYIMLVAEHLKINNPIMMQAKVIKGQDGQTSLSDWQVDSEYKPTKTFKNYFDKSRFQ